MSVSEWFHPTAEKSCRWSSRGNLEGLFLFLFSLPPSLPRVFCCLFADRALQLATPAVLLCDAYPATCRYLTFVMLQLQPTVQVLTSLVLSPLVLLTISTLPAPCPRTQPALLYLVPCTLGPFVFISYHDGTLRSMWDGPPSLTAEYTGYDGLLSNAGSPMVVSKRSSAGDWGGGLGGGLGLSVSGHGDGTPLDANGESVVFSCPRLLPRGSRLTVPCGIHFFDYWDFPV